MRRIAAVALLGLASALAAPARAQLEAQPRIANGAITPSYPEVGAFLTPTAECTATLIGCRTALTAAHCVCDPSGAGASCGPGLDNGMDFLVDPTTTAFFLPQAGFLPVASIEIPADFSFGEQGDVAVLELDTQVRGLRPRAINELARPPIGTVGLLVGYGLDAAGLGVSTDSGLRRAGTVVTSSCMPGGIPAATNICFDPASNSNQSNTCDGDSGGPLLADLGAGPTLAGVTSGGDVSACQISGFSFDTDVFVVHDWLRQQTGIDLSSTQCGDGPQVGDPDATTLYFSSAFTSQIQKSFQVPAGTKLLRVGLNGSDSSPLGLQVNPFSPPSGTNAACTSADPFGGSFQYCELPDPPPGTWFALVDAGNASVTYQLTATLLPEDPAPPIPALGWLFTTNFTSDELMEVDPATGTRAVVASRLRGVGPDLGSPEGLTLDAHGAVLIANPSDLNLVRVDPTSGDRAVVSGCMDAVCSSTRGTGPAFFAPRFVATARDGSIVVADRSNPGTYAIVRVDPASGDRSVVSGCADPSCLSVVGSGPAIQRLFGIRLDPTGAIFAVDGQALYRIDAASGDRTLISGCVDAACTSSVGSGPIAGQPGDLWIDPNAGIYVTYRIEGTPFGALRLVDPATGDRTQVSGCVDAACTSQLGTGPSFVDLFGIAISPDGSLQVADGGLETILRIDRATGDRTPLSGCSDAGCPSAVGSGPGFADTLGLAVIPEPDAASASGATLAALAALARARRDKRNQV